MAFIIEKNLSEKAYLLKQRTCVEFLDLVKIPTETSILIDRGSWTKRISQLLQRLRFQSVSGGEIDTCYLQHWLSAGLTLATRHRLPIGGDIGYLFFATLSKLSVMELMATCQTQYKNKRLLAFTK